MNRDQRVDESLRLMVTALAYVIAAAVCITISVMHMANEKWGWGWTMWLLGIALLILAQLAKRESLRTFPEASDE